MDCKIKLTWLFRGPGTEHRGNLIPADLFYFLVPLSPLARRRRLDTRRAQAASHVPSRRNDKVRPFRGGNVLNETLAVRDSRSVAENRDLSPLFWTASDPGLYGRAQRSFVAGTLKKPQPTAFARDNRRQQSFADSATGLITEILDHAYRRRAGRGFLENRFHASSPISRRIVRSKKREHPARMTHIKPT